MVHEGVITMVGYDAVVAACQRYIDRHGLSDFIDSLAPSSPVVRRLGPGVDKQLHMGDRLAFAFVSGVDDAPQSAAKFVIVVRGRKVVAAIPTDKYGGLLAIRVALVRP